MILTLALLAQVVAATPAPPPRKFSGGFGRPATTSQTRVVITQDDLPAPPPTAAVPFVPGLTRAAPLPVQTPSAPIATAAVDEEATWRGRYSAARARLDSALSALRAAEQSVGDVVSVGGRVGTGPSQAHRIMAQARDNALLPYRMAVEDAQREVESVRSACRVTVGCAPGWVR